MKGDNKMSLKDLKIMIMIVAYTAQAIYYIVILLDK